MCLCSKWLTQPVWDVQILHISKKGLAPDRLLGDSLYALAICCLIRVSQFTWGLGPCRIVYANNATYGRDHGSGCISLTPGGAGD